MLRAVVMRFAPVVAALVEQGWYSGVGLLADEQLRALAQVARAGWHDGRYQPAGIGRERGHRVAAEIRGDSVWWVEEGDEADALAPYRRVVDELRSTLNRELFLGLESFELQFARYADGAHYDRHLDRFSDHALRTISCILYLNEGWTADDGGELRLHLADGPRDLAPRLGSWVIFRSELIEHEVCPARRERYSLTGWFRRRALDPLRG